MIPLTTIAILFIAWCALRAVAEAHTATNLRNHRRCVTSPSAAAGP
jgi:hypothetical protein